MQTPYSQLGEAPSEREWHDIHRTWSSYEAWERPSAGALPGANITWAGLFFQPRSRSHTGMDEFVERIIRRALDEAREKGRDHLAQTQAAIDAARQARPDMTASEILAAVRLVQHQ